MANFPVIWLPTSILNIQSSLSLASSQAETLRTFKVLWAVTLVTYINRHDNIPRGSEAEIFTCCMPFLSLNQQHQSTDGTVSRPKYKYFTHYYLQSKNLQLTYCHKSWHL